MLRIKIFNQTGALILEAMLAVIILSTGLIVVIQGLQTGSRAAREVEGCFAAALAAEKAMTEFSLKKFSSELWNKEIDTGKGYKVRLRTHPTEDFGEQGGMQEAEVDVFWRTGRKDKKMSFSTVFLDRRI